MVPAKPPPVCAESRFTKPRLQGVRDVTFCGVQKVTQKARGASPATSVQSSTQANFYRNCCGSCLKQLLGFEPVRKGSCSTDARVMFFENGMPHCKLTGASRILKGNCSLSLLRWEFVFLHADLMFRDKSGLLAFAQSGSMLIEKFDLSQSFAFPEKFRSI